MQGKPNLEKLSQISPSVRQNPDKILVGLSGGVDSAVCVRLLQQQGFEVHAVVISFSPASNNAVKQATLAAKELGIPVMVHHCEPLFEENVIKPFCEAYINGQTPNPCIFCNPSVKFRALIDIADSLGINYIATGHYARVVEKDGVWHVARAASAARDQSYMLYRLAQPVLSRLCLPVGEFEKPDIRQMALDENLSAANTPDSQEICFIPDGNYAKYILERNLKSKKGNFISPEGETLAPHEGILHYTVGQRRGLGIALGKPVFVKKILENGDIVLAYSGDEYSSKIDLFDIFSTSGQDFSLDEEYFVKIRSAAQPVSCRLEKTNTAELSIVFKEAQRAPAPGQSAVLYINDCIVGGGFIAASHE